jgi:hypothetical protein
MHARVRVLFLTLVVLAALSVHAGEPFPVAERAWVPEPVDVIGGGDDGFYAFGGYGVSVRTAPDGTLSASEQDVGAPEGFGRSVAVGDGVAVVVYRHSNDYRDVLAVDRGGALLWRKRWYMADAVVFDGEHFVTVGREFGQLHINMINIAGASSFVTYRFVEEAGESRRDVAAAMTNDGVLIVWSTASSVKGAFFRNGEIGEPFLIASHGAQVSVASNGADSLVMMADAEHLLFGVRLDGNGKALAPAEVVAAMVRPVPAAVLWDGFRYRTAWIQASAEGPDRAAIADVSGFATPSRPTHFPAPCGAGTSLAVAGGRVALSTGTAMYVSDVWRDSSTLVRSEPRVLLSRTIFTGSVSAVWTGDRYLVAWVQETTPLAIVVRPFARDGRPLGEAVTVIRKAREGRPSVGAQFVLPQIAPLDQLQLLYGGGRVALLWDEDGRTIRGIRLTPGGQLLDDAPFDVANSPSFSAATDGHNIHVVFRDDDCCTLLGRRFPFRGRIDEEPPIVVATRASEIFEPRIRFDGTRYALLLSELSDHPWVAGVRQTPLLATMTGDWAIDSWTAQPSFVPPYSAVPLTLAANGAQSLVLNDSVFDAAWDGNSFLSIGWRGIQWYRAGGTPLAQQPLSIGFWRAAIASAGDGTALVVVHESAGGRPLVGRIVKLE